MRAALIHDVNTENGKSVVFPHLKGLQNGDSANSRIKQVRVYPSYCFYNMLYVTKLVLSVRLPVVDSA